VSDGPRRWLTLIADLPRRIGYLWGPRLMSAARKRWVLLRHRHVEVRFEGPVYLGPGFSIHSPERATFIVGPDVEFRRGFRVELERGATVRIGRGSRFTYDVLIQCGELIEIGEGCMFGQSTAMFDGNHRFRDLSKPMLEQGYDLKPVRIEDEAIVTTKCTIIGATIGKRAFIGANSVVTRDIPPYAVAVGAPAKPIDYFGPEGERPSAPSISRSDRSG
jgi:acetyltransferase-like isoleucine patch superfamily enzyme